MPEFGAFFLRFTKMSQTALSLSSYFSDKPCQYWLVRRTESAVRADKTTFFRKPLNNLLSFYFRI
jgi:hypothetical protein